MVTPQPLRQLLLMLGVSPAGVLAGVGSHTFYWARGASYLSDQPQTCANGHVMRGQLAEVEPPRRRNLQRVSCAARHPRQVRYKLETGYRHSAAFSRQIVMDRAAEAIGHARQGQLGIAPWARPRPTPQSP